MIFPLCFIAPVVDTLTLETLIALQGPLVGSEARRL